MQSQVHEITQRKVGTTFAKAAGMDLRFVLLVFCILGLWMPSTSSEAKNGPVNRSQLLMQKNSGVRQIQTKRNLRVLRQKMLFHESRVKLLKKHLFRLKRSQSHQDVLSSTKTKFVDQSKNRSVMAFVQRKKWTFKPSGLFDVLSLRTPSGYWEKRRKKIFDGVAGLGFDHDDLANALDDLAKASSLQLNADFAWPTVDVDKRNFGSYDGYDFAG